jgi:hypothetical protein
MAVINAPAICGSGSRVAGVVGRRVRSTLIDSEEVFPMSYVKASLIATRFFLLTSSHTLLLSLCAWQNSTCVVSLPAIGMQCAPHSPIAPPMPPHNCVDTWLTIVQAPRCAEIQADSPENGQGVSEASLRSCTTQLTHCAQCPTSGPRLE